MDIELKWRTKIRNQRVVKGAVAPILALCGPSGVGKTTIATRLSDIYPVYIETTKGNPHFKALLEGREDFDAAENQEWFLHRISAHISRASPQRPLVLDQDPAAIVLVYARLFHDRGLITQERYQSLIVTLLKIEESLLRWRSPRTVLCLDAPADILRKRVIRRSGGSETPPLEWLAGVRTAFQKLVATLPNAMIVSTGKLSASEIAALARQLIEGTEAD